MAQEYYYSNRLLTAAIETVSGTDEVPTPAANSIWASDVNVNWEGDENERNADTGNHGAKPWTYGNKRGTMTFTVELAGSGVVGAAPPIGPVLRGMGWAEVIDAGVSVTYNPISTGFETLSIYVDVDGVLYKCIGSLGDGSWNVAVDGFGTITCTYTGDFQPWTERAFVAGDFTSFVVPTTVESVNSSFTLNAVALDCRNWSLGQGNEINRLHTTDTKKTAKTGHNHTGSFRIWRPLLATANVLSMVESHSIFPLVFTIGTAPGYIVKISQNVQLQYPTESNDQNVHCYDVGYKAIPSGAGGDETTIEFT